jgi:flagellar motor switch protein FliN/FliY
MAFSTSPLIPDQRSGDGVDWDATAETTLAAVQEALPQIPTAAPLSAGTPIANPEDATLPNPAGAAVTAFLTGDAQGKILLVVGQDLVDALSGTPFGALEPAKALRPALEAVAAALGSRLDGEPTATPAEECLDVLAGGICVIVPLMTDEGLTALIGLSFIEAPVSAASKAKVAGAARSWGIEMLRDVEMEVTCELGRTRMTVRQLLALAPGDVVELDRLAGSPADLLVNGTLLARGEVVVVDESFGLRITEIVTRDAS